MRKINNIRDLIILILFTILIIFNNEVDKKYNSNPDKEIIYDYNLDDLYRLIYSSNYLSKEEMDYLYNSKFLSDVLNTVNKYDNMKKLYDKCFNNIDIKSFSDNDVDYSYFDTGVNGIYSTSEPNILYIRDYNEVTSKNKDVLAHEFIHLCQDTTGYNLIIESCAEIISNEYYDDTKIDSYLDQVKLVKKMMEIIGTETIWNYNFSGDFSDINCILKNNLSDSEYKEFINDLSFDYIDNENNVKKYKSLDKLLNKLYSNMYGDKVENNLVLSLIDKEDRSLVRYYFNSDLINDGSYYLDYNKGNYEYMSYYDAIKDGYLIVNAISKKPIDKEDALKLIDNGYTSIGRNIDYMSANISIIARTDTMGKTYISCLIDGNRYDKVDVDELVKKSIIDAQYYLVDFKNLSALEYVNGNYDDNAQLYFSCAGDTELVDNNRVYAYVPKKVKLPKVFKTSYYEEEVDKKVLRK